MLSPVFSHVSLSHALLTLLLFVSSSNSQRYEGDACTEGGLPGICRQLKECRVIYDELVSGKYPTNICGFSNFEPIVCCPTTTTTSKPTTTTTTTTPRTTTTTTTTTSRPDPLKPSTDRGVIARAKCAEYAKSVYRVEVSPVLSVNRPTVNTSTCGINAPKYIVGGTKADPKEFPHMAAVGYNGEGTILWLCGGTLISERYVLTAAHCTFSSMWGRATMVRVGDLNLVRDDDDANPRNIKIAERIRHPDYQRPAEYHDIALLRLETSVVFSAWIRPACLPYSLPDIGTAGSAIATGWGSVEWAEDGSNDLLKVTLKLVSQPVCNTKFVGGGPDDKLNRGILGDIQICAGSEGKDTCQGDSGGPLAIHNSDYRCMYNVIGVTSVGRYCGSFIPGVYTRVYNYIPWIESIVWPDA